MKEFKLGRHMVGTNHPTYVIAELSANHNQDYEEAVKLIHAAKESGVQAIKVQTYTADTITLNSRKDYFMINSGTIWDGMNLHDLYKEAYTPWEWQPKLMKVANDLGLDFFSSPFDLTAVDFLEDMNVPFYKVASFEVVHIPMLKKIAATKKPVIMSTGIANLEEIEFAVKTLKENGTKDLILLKCTSAYPAKLEDANLCMIEDLAKRFDVICGLSDHTIGVEVPVGSVHFGGRVIEKHFINSRSVDGPDSKFSSEPHEFVEFIQAVRDYETGKKTDIDPRVVGKISYDPKEAENATRVYRPSLWVGTSMKKGDVFSLDNIRYVRPGHGLMPKYLDQVLGQVAACDIDEATPVSWDLIEGHKATAHG